MSWRRLERSSVIEPGIVVAIWLAVSLGAQRWAGLDTPDSSFYTSLGLFGSEVTDRTFEPSYFWTRLGVIAPFRGLTALLGTWAGFAAWRMLLIGIFVASAYLVLRRFTGIASAGFLTLAVSLSTVVLSYFGNTYLTGAVLAGTMALVACATIGGRGSAAVAGVLLGWLAMVNPPGVLLAGVIWVAVSVHARARTAKDVVATFAIAAGTTALTFLAFLGIGRLMFPGMDWLGAYLDANATMDYSDFASKDAVWLHDISLIVPVAVLIVSIAAVAMRRTSPAARRALVISATSIGFMLVFNPWMGGIPLEAPIYQAMLWPPALIALALVATDVMPPAWRWYHITAAAVGVVIVVIAGFLDPGLSLAVGWAVAAVLVIAFIVAPVRSAFLGVVTLVLLLTGAQLLQNSRGDLGLYYLSPYHWAFTSNPISERIHAAVNSQEFVLANTTRADTILVWVDGDWVNGDRELYVVGGMQLWGNANIATLGPTMDDAALAHLADLRPSVVMMVGQSTDRVLAFWSTLPQANRPSAPICYDYPWASNPASAFTITEGHTCLTRLVWD